MFDYDIDPNFPMGHLTWQLISCKSYETYNITQQQWTTFGFMDKAWPKAEHVHNDQ